MAANPDSAVLPIHPAHLPRAPLSFVFEVARGRYRPWILLLLACEAVNAGCGILLPFALGRILNQVTSANGLPSAVFKAQKGVALFGLLCVGELVFGRLSSAIQMRVTPRQRQYVARALFRYLHGHSHRFLTENFAGALANRIAETSHGVNQVLWSLVTELWPMAIVISVSNVLLALASPWLGLFTGVWAVGFVACSLVLARRTQPLAAAASSARSRTVGMIVDSVSNHAAVRLFARLDHERVRLDAAYAPELETVLRANLAMERVRLFQFAASAVLKAGIVMLAVWLWGRGSIGVGQFAMSVSLSLLIIAEVRNLSRRFLELFEALGNVGSGVRAIFRPHELIDGERAGELPIARGALQFDRVQFRYADGSGVFRGLSVSIPAGQRVGLVGLSGSGKSTFVNLVLRLYEPQAGAIRIDGHELSAFTQDALRRQIGLIPQDPTLFHRSLRENIRYGRLEASDVEVEQAAQRAHADEFIAQLPEGYDTQVGERGVKLSGGQRQRVAIARVILKNAPLLILDEATASLDSITEHAIQAALDDAMTNKTVLVIAHRLSTIAHLDRILVFSKGEIIEDGSHRALLARRGHYHQLWTRQSGGLLPDEPTLTPTLTTDASLHSDVAE
jgi:ATP-binding cassette subfamily B protein